VVVVLSHELPWRKGSQRAMTPKVTQQGHTQTQSQSPQSR
jgi:hypothetical protein